MLGSLSAFALGDEFGGVAIAAILQSRANEIAALRRPSCFLALACCFDLERGPNGGRAKAPSPTGRDSLLLIAHLLCRRSCLSEGWPFPALPSSWLRLLFSFLPLFSFLLRARSFLFRVTPSSRPLARGGPRCRGRDRNKQFRQSAFSARRHRRLADCDCR